MSETYLTVEQVAERLNTKPRFPRRLIAERRITFVKVGRHVRISESALEAWLTENTVTALVRPRRLGRAA